MLGKQDRWQEDLFVACPLRDLVPEDHILKRVDVVLDLGWLREEVRDLYDEAKGRPSIDPEAAVRLMLAGFFEGIVHDRKLLRQAQVNLAIRWFAGYRLHEKLPDHSSLTRIRQRWGAERFKRIFQRTVTACMEAGLVDAETVHIDATLIRADASWDSMVVDHAQKVLEENVCREEDSAGPKGPPGKGRKRSRTDPDATLASDCRTRRAEPSYKQHTAVEDKSAVIVDVEVTTGETNEGHELLEQIDRVEEMTGTTVDTVTADTAYAHGTNYAELESRRVNAVIPPQREWRKSKRISINRFTYDHKHKVVRCPRRKILHRCSHGAFGYLYRASAKDCKACPLQARCIPPKVSARTIVIVDGYPALLRARRRRRRWDVGTHATYERHRWKVEGVHGQAKTQHGLRRAVRRGLHNVSIQVYLTAAVINLKRLAALLLWLLRTSWLVAERVQSARAAHTSLSAGTSRNRLRITQLAKATE